VFGSSGDERVFTRRQGARPRPLPRLPVCRPLPRSPPRPPSPPGPRVVASQLIEGSLPSSPHHSCPSAISHRRSPIVNHSSIPPLPPAPPWVGPRAPTAAHPPPPSPSPTPAPSGRSSGASPPAPPSAGTSSASFGASIPTQPPPPQHGGCEPPPPQGLPPLPTATQNSGRLIHIKTRPLPGASGRGGAAAAGACSARCSAGAFPPPTSPLTLRRWARCGPPPATPPVAGIPPGLSARYPQPPERPQSRKSFKKNVWEKHTQ